MKKRKVLYFISGIVFLSLAGLYFFGGLLVSKVALVGIEAFVPQATKASVSVKDLRISPLSGSGTVRGFHLGNPEGYWSDYSIRFESAEVELSPTSLLRDTIIIERVRVFKPRFMLERRLLTSNIREILKNVEEAAKQAEKSNKGSAKESETATQDEETRIIIKTFIIEEGMISLYMAGAAVPVILPRIELHDLGGKGARPGQITLEVLQIVLSRVLTAVAKAPGGVYDGVKSLFHDHEEEPTP